MKRALALILALVLVFCLLAACGAMSKEELVGTWSGEWDFNGYHWNEELTLKANGTYVEKNYRDGKYYDTETGTYELDGSTLRCYENGNQGGPITKYKVSSSTLKSGDAVLRKVG